MNLNLQTLGTALAGWAIINAVLGGIILLIWRPGRREGVQTRDTLRAEAVLDEVLRAQHVSGMRPGQPAFHAVTVEAVFGAMHYDARQWWVTHGMPMRLLLTERTTIREYMHNVGLLNEEEAS